MRRVLRRRQKQVEAAAQAAEKSIDSNFIGRFDKLLHVRRFTFGWLTLAVLAIACTIIQTVSLSSYYQTAQPAPGGIYHEGIVGTYSNANPLFATGSVDVAVSRLIFAGLLKYDEQNKLAGDLASEYSVDGTGKHYSVKLRPNLKWHDGQPLTAADVAFTYRLIQNPDVRSPLLPSWQNIKVTAPDALTVNFDLPNVFSAFPYSLVTGILPEHVLANVPAAQLRSDAFNTVHPVGAGPFAWQAIQVSSNTDPDKVVDLIALKAFKDYVGGTPGVNGFVLHAFGGKDEMIAAFKKRDINAMAGLNSVPAGMEDASDIKITSFSSTAAVMTFFKTSGVLSSGHVRQALVRGADTQAIIDKLGYTTRPVKEPFLMSQLGYNRAYAQAGYNPAEANNILDKAGWARGKDGIRSKDGQRLAFRLYAEDNVENRRAAGMLAKTWKTIGVEATPVLQSQTDFQNTLAFHGYDALLYNISIGVDPDVYAYWDSKEADIRATNRFNFSEYTSGTADVALEAGRTRLDPVLRAVKYKPFLQAWQTDAPALGMYQPRFLYITRGTVYGLNERTLNTDADRYGSVAQWRIHTVKVTNN